MRKQHKTYDVPMKKWDATRLESEAEVMKKFGLKNKRQLWKAKSMLRRFRTTAKTLFSSNNEAAERKKKELIDKLVRYGLLSEGAAIDDVLPMTVEQLLGRQLQFIVKSKGLAVSPKQARQLIVHGHIAIGDARVTRPSYMVSVEEEKTVKYSPTSPVSLPGHPIRSAPKASLKSETETALAEIREKKIAIEAGKAPAPEKEEKPAENKTAAKPEKTEKSEKKTEAPKKDSEKKTEDKKPKPEKEKKEAD